MKKCEFKNCNRNKVARGFCATHYCQMIRHGKLTVIRKFRFSPVNKVNKTQLCTQCEYWLPFNNFTNRKDDRKNERYSVCKRCKTYNRYNMTARDYDIMLKKQNYKCLCCSKKHSKSKLHVYHNHSCCPGHKSCGKCIRGLLCNGCNAAIGHLKEDVKIAKKVVSYLENINAK